MFQLTLKSTAAIANALLPHFTPLQCLRFPDAHAHTEVSARRGRNTHDGLLVSTGAALLPDSRCVYHRASLTPDQNMSKIQCPTIAGGRICMHPITETHSNQDQVPWPRLPKNSDHEMPEQHHKALSPREEKSKTGNSRLQEHPPRDPDNSSAFRFSRLRKDVR